MKLQAPLVHQASRGHSGCTTPPKCLNATINVVNDDHDVKMWTIDADDTYGYDVKFLSFYNLEGDSFRYGIRLDTEPKTLFV